jgi:hypothetical protein
MAEKKQTYIKKARQKKRQKILILKIKKTISKNKTNYKKNKFAKIH